MEHLYFHPEQSVREVKAMLAAFEADGYDADNVQFGQSWECFLKEIPDHSTVVLYSVDFFPSLMELLSTLAQLQEPWLSGEVGSTADFLLKLRELALSLHQNRTQQGLDKARAAGKKIGRPRKVVGR